MSCGAIRLLIYPISHSLEVTVAHSGAICPLARATRRIQNPGISLIFSSPWLCVNLSCEQEFSKPQSIRIEQHNKPVLTGSSMAPAFLSPGTGGTLAQALHMP